VHDVVEMVVVEALDNLGCVESGQLLIKST